MGFESRDLDRDTRTYRYRKREEQQQIDIYPGNLDVCHRNRDANKARGDDGRHISIGDLGFVHSIKPFLTAITLWHRFTAGVGSAGETIGEKVGPKIQKKAVCEQPS